MGMLVRQAFLGGLSVLGALQPTSRHGLQAVSHPATCFVPSCSRFIWIPRRHVQSGSRVGTMPAPRSLVVVA